MIRFFTRGALAATTAIALALPAAAQTIDYGSLEQLFGEAVTTSATGKPQRASEVPANMVILTQEEIRRTGATNIADVLQRVVGVDVNRWGMGSADVAVRGYNSPLSPRLLVLVNGRQVYLDHFGMTNWNAIPVEMSEIRQIEVVKGPNTALFGFNAVGGVVNIVTFSPLYDDVDEGVARIGTQAYRELSAVTTFKPHEKVGVRLSAGGYDSDDFDEVTTGLEPSRRSASGSVLAQVTPDSQLGADFSVVASEQSENIPANSIMTGDYDTYSGKLTYTANTNLGLLEASVYHNVTDIDAPEGNDFNNAVTVAKVQDLFKIGTDHSFRLTGEYRHNKLDSAPDEGGTVSYDVYSAGGMWDWAILDQVNLVNALRVDHLRLDRTGSFSGLNPQFTNEDYDRSLTELSVNSGIVYKPTDEDTLRLTYARGVQAPSLFEYARMMTFEPIGFYGNPDIDPTIVTNYELGYDRDVAAIGGGFGVAVYYQTNDSLKSELMMDPTTGNLIDSNVGDSKAIGVEATVNGTVGEQWSWKLGYAFENVSDDFESMALNFEDSTPRHMLSGQVGFTEGKWEADMFGQYVSGTKMLFSTDGGMTTSLDEVDPYVMVSARVGYNVTDSLNLAVTAMNLTRDETEMTAGPAEERRVLFSITNRF